VRAGSQQAVSRAEYKQWMSEGNIRVDRLATREEFATAIQQILWDRRIIRRDLGLTWEINDKSETYQQGSIMVMPDSGFVWEFVVHESRAIETLAGVDTRRYVFWMLSPFDSSSIVVADAWLADESPPEPDLKTIYPVLLREMQAVGDLRSGELFLSVAQQFARGEKMPMRLTVGLAHQGLDTERFARIVDKMEAYGDLPLNRRLALEIFELEEADVPREQFELPEGLKNASSRN
jgi:hypothetical protein